MSSTLKTIAQETGFSVTTVSRALAGYDDVSESTRRLILAEAERQGYEPNMNARLLQKQRTQTIGLIVPLGGPRTPDPFFSELAAGVSNRATQSGYDVLLNTDTSVSELEVYRRLVSRNRVDGIVIVRTRRHDPRIDYMIESGTPFVCFGRTDRADGYVYIDIDGVAGQQELTEHFIGLGHRRIAYIAPPEMLMFAEHRLRGFTNALQAHNLAPDPELILHSELSERAGHDAAQLLLAKPQPPTAIMTGNDLMALGVMRAIRERGLHVGEDVAVGGFDDVPTSQYVHPSLTTVHQPIYEIGQQLVDTLVQIISGEPLVDPAILLKPDIVVRESSGPPR